MAADMRHMQHLEVVAASDVAVLRKKEATYQGSWKAAGGVSAWFMMRRNLDRLIVMMRPPSMAEGFSLADLDDLIDSHGKLGSPEFDGDRTLDVSILQYLRECYVAQDVFKKIGDDPSGQDGSVLAVIRDARRYMMLVEAEMIAQGEVKAEGMELVSLSGTELRHIHLESHVPGQGGGGVSSGGGGSGSPGPMPSCSGGRGGSPMTRPVAAAAEAATPEERGELRPVSVRAVEVAVMTKVGAQTILSGSGDMNWVLDTLFQDCGQQYLKLEPYLEAAHQYRMEMLATSLVVPADARELLGSILSLYNRVGGLYILDVGSIAAKYDRDYWPRFPQELNATEHRAQPSWVRVLYEFHEGPTKWIMRPQHRAWAVEP